MSRENNIDHVVLKCVGEVGPRGGEHNRVHFEHYLDAHGNIVHDEDFDHDLNIDFPKKLRRSGQRYRVKADDFELVEPTKESYQQKPFYRVLTHDIEVEFSYCHNLALFAKLNLISHINHDSVYQTLFMSTGLQNRPIWISRLLLLRLSWYHVMFIV